MKKGMTFPMPLPTKVVSNEEFSPIGQTAEQARVEHVTGELVVRRWVSWESTSGVFDYSVRYGGCAAAHE
jgi:hypothetical protein